MVASLILVVGFFQLVSVDLAPTPLSSTRALSFEVPAIANRFNFEDKRQNWGVLMNGSRYIEKENVNYDYRPITIPRQSTLSAEESRVTPSSDAQKNVNIHFKSKRFTGKATEVNDGTKSINNEPNKTPLDCDIARIKCCFNKADLDSCSKANQCVVLENPADLCDARVLQEIIKRILSSSHT